MDYRIEHDTMGEVRVPANHYWGAQTQRSHENFPIGTERIPEEVISAFAVLKKAAALANCKLGNLDERRANAIAAACDEILAGRLADEFPPQRPREQIPKLQRYVPNGDAHCGADRGGGSCASGGGSASRHNACRCSRECSGCCDCGVSKARDTFASARKLWAADRVIYGLITARFALYQMEHSSIPTNDRRPSRYTR